jgi:2-hydroxychromene-2-carboxylate isomerase
VLRPILSGLGLDADALLAGAVSDANKAALRAHTDAAIARGLFGAPTMFAGREMFWGDDRVEEALAWARGGNDADPP